MDSFKNDLRGLLFAELIVKVTPASDLEHQSSVAGICSNDQKGQSVP